MLQQLGSQLIYFVPVSSPTGQPLAMSTAADPVAAAFVLAMAESSQTPGAEPQSQQMAHAVAYSIVVSLSRAQTSGDYRQQSRLFLSMCCNIHIRCKVDSSQLLMQDRQTDDTQPELEVFDGDTPLLAKQAEIMNSSPER